MHGLSLIHIFWGYISDKLNIPVSRLSQDNIEEELRNYGVTDALIKEFLDALNNCEFARFAPGDDNQAMDCLLYTSLTTGMDQVIVGQKHLVESLLIGLLSDGHVLLEGCLLYTSRCV